MPGSPRVKLTKYFKAMSKSDGQVHHGRSEGKHISNELPYPACLNACEEDDQCLATTFRVGDEGKSEACILLSSVDQRLVSSTQNIWSTWFKNSGREVDTELTTFTPHANQYCEGGHIADDTLELDECEAECSQDPSCTCFHFRADAQSCRRGHAYVTKLEESHAGYTAYLRDGPLATAAHVAGHQVVTPPMVALACNSEIHRLCGSPPDYSATLACLRYARATNGPLAFSKDCASMLARSLHSSRDGAAPHITLPSETAAAEEVVEVAQGKPATVAAPLDELKPPGLAVDGDYSMEADRCAQVGSEGSVTEQAPAFWSVHIGDKGESFLIKDVVLFLLEENKELESLSDEDESKPQFPIPEFEVRAGMSQLWQQNQPCGKLAAHRDDQGALYTAQCGSRRAAFIHVVSHRQAFGLCEAQVHAILPRQSDQQERVLSHSAWNVEEVAHGKPVEMSSSANILGIAAKAGLAVDGNFDNNFKAGSCSHTDTQEDPWFRVDLQRRMDVDTVTVWNRGDCCGDRLSNFEVRVGNHPDWKDNSRCGRRYSCPNAQSLPVQCEGRPGEYVHIVVPGKNRVLALCELTVHARYIVKKDDEDVHEGVVEVALHKPAFQSSTLTPITNEGSKWHICAESEGLTCHCEGTVRYARKFRDAGGPRFAAILFDAEEATGTGYKDRDVSGSVTCNNQEFGDPLVGILKHCYCKPFELPEAPTNRPHPYDSINAVDGNLDNALAQGSCTHTNLETSPWWMVDLEEKVEVKSVLVWNRGDCCGARLSNFEVRVGEEKDWRKNTACVHAQKRTFSAPQAGVQVVQCGGLAAQFVHIVLPDQKQYLTLCEVQVHAHIESVTSLLPQEETDHLDAGGVLEVASNQPATSSSEAFDGAPQRAVDGNINQGFAGRSCTHTEKEFQPWWRVDLGIQYAVVAVTVWNRADCCGERLSNFEVSVGPHHHWEKNKVCSDKRWSIPQGQHLMIPCHRLKGRFVHVVLREQTQWLTLCEVRVMAAEVDDDDDELGQVIKAHDNEPTLSDHDPKGHVVEDEQEKGKEKEKEEEEEREKEAEEEREKEAHDEYEKEMKQEEQEKKAQGLTEAAVDPAQDVGPPPSPSPPPPASEPATSPASPLTAEANKPQRSSIAKYVIMTVLVAAAIGSALVFVAVKKAESEVAYQQVCTDQFDEGMHSPTGQVHHAVDDVTEDRLDDQTL